MMTPPETIGTDLSPLDQIRLTEAEVARRIAAAREAAEQMAAQERTRVKRLKREAREAGTREGQTRYKDIVSKAEEEACSLITQAQNRAEELRRKGQRRMSAAVCDAVKMIIGLEEEIKNE